jgi:hypothetical protein
MKIAFATCSAMQDGVADDRSAAEALDATFEVWDDQQAEWEAYDRVILRSVWDYTHHLDAFLAWCRSVGSARLRNDPDLVAFAADKRYLADLSVPTVPTTFVLPGCASPVLHGEVVVKPSVSAGARNTGRFGPAKHRDALQLIDRITASGCAALIQPYLTDVDTRGEIAMVHFHGVLSHVLRKRAVLRPDEVAPVAAGTTLGVAAAMLAEDLVAPGHATPQEIALARDLLAQIAAHFGGPPLYARVDVVTNADGDPMLLELEVVEPSLYLGLADRATDRFVAAVRAS